MRIVLDTNVLIAAFISRGVCHEIFENIIRYHQLVLSDFIIYEFKDKLKNKFKFDEKEINEAVQLLEIRAILIRPIPLSKQICPDPDDDNILATGVTGNCNCIITGDKELINVKRFGNTDITSPSEFWEYEAIRG